MNVRKQVVSVSKPAQILGARINAAAKSVTLWLPIRGIT